MGQITDDTFFTIELKDIKTLLDFVRTKPLSGDNWLQLRNEAKEILGRYVVKNKIIY